MANSSEAPETLETQGKWQERLHSLEHKCAQDKLESGNINTFVLISGSDPKPQKLYVRLRKDCDLLLWWIMECYLNDPLYIIYQCVKN